MAAAVRRAGVAGWDTETYGHDVRETSPAHRARVHVWSLAVPTGTKAPRGHRVAAGVTLPGRALTWPALAEVLADPAVLKIAHNAPHDWHAAANAGVIVRGLVDTLPWARVALPEWSGFPGHGLKELARRLLGRDMTEYKEVLSEPNEVVVAKTRRSTKCVRDDGSACPTEGCRRRVGHKRVVEVTVEHETMIRGTRLMPLESVGPDSPRWPTLVAYAAQDAEAAMELYDLLVANERPFASPVPW